MQRKAVLGIMLTVLLFCTSAPIFFFPPSLAQPSEEDWDVIGVEVAENEMIELSGNLTVKAGGSLTLSNVTLRMNVEHDGQYGILVEDGGSLSIYNSNISSATGFRFFFSVMLGGFVMKNSELYDAGWGGGADWSGEPRKRGLYVQADDAVIDGNFISDSLGVFLCLCHNSSVTNNKLVTDYGITITHNVPPFQMPSNNSILNNTVRGALENGITIGAGNNNVVANNTILDAMVGIMMWESWNNIVENNSVVPEHHPDPWGGIVLWNWCGNNTIVNNTIKMEQAQWMIDGIEVVRSVNNRIEGNTVENLRGGITLSYAHNNAITNNSVSNILLGTDPMHSAAPSPDAIQLYHSSNNTVINNRISNVQSNAILLWDMSKNNVLQANVVNSSYNGISLHYSSDNNTIVNNAVGNIGSWTILLDESNENIAYDNNFLDPIVEAYDNGMNHWNLEGHGNYWGDYEGRDKDGDGIGDTPHYILTNGIDGFPLTSPKPITFVPIPILEQASPPLGAPGPTNAIITAEETWKDTAVTMDHITVKNGGNLTLQNMTIMFYTGFSGISVEAGGSLYILNSKITAADPDYGGYAFLIWNAKDFVMKNSELHYAGFCFQSDFPGGLSVLATNATIEDNTFAHNYRAIWVGMQAQYPPFVTITNNTISCSYNGIVYYMGDVINNTISKIIHAGIHGGISSQWWRQYYFLTNNDITQVWSGGIVLDHTDGGTWVMNNKISSSEEGIFLLSNVANSRIDNNAIDDTWRWAIKTSKSEHSSPANVVTNNTILNCAGGIYLAEGSLGTLIYGNNIISSPNSCDMGSNSWDYNGKGNYWSDYIGTDSNGDGAGDTPYTVPPNGLDRYPLIVPAVWNFSDPVPVNWEGTIYPVALSSNSTISTFKFNQSQKQISFDAIGASDSIGYCNITIPKTLLKDSPWTITINNLPITNYTKTENDTHTSLYFAYMHASTSHIIIRGTSTVPEFPSIPTLSVFMILTVLLVLFTRKKKLANQRRCGHRENIRLFYSRTDRLLSASGIRKF